MDNKQDKASTWIIHIIGIVVYVTRFNVALGENKANSKMEQKAFKNNPDGHEKFLNWLRENLVRLPHTLVCVVNNKPEEPSLIEFLRSNEAIVWEDDYFRVGWFMNLKFLDLAKPKDVCAYAFMNKQQIMRDLFLPGENFLL